LLALVNAAHRRHKIVVVHIGNESQARDVIAAGADGLAHMFFGKISSDDFGRFGARHRVFVIPTLVTLYASCGMGNGKMLLADPHLGPYIQPALARLHTITWQGNPDICRGTNEGMRQLIKQHVPILAGTDEAIPGTTYGASLHGELELLVKLGMTPTQALAAATSLPAHYFHLDDQGVIRSGARANLLLVEGDPTQNILATRNTVAVFKKGFVSNDRRQRTY
jgi:imidazolonepropionase-like amidohydrolase